VFLIVPAFYCGSTYTTNNDGGNMKASFTRTGCLVVCLFLATSVIAEKPEPEPSDGVYRFVGFSDEMMDGTGGLLKRYQACQTTYGTGARMCNSKEIIETADLPSDLVGDAWVQPVLILYADIYGAVDISGASGGISYHTCQQWSSNVYKGMSIDSSIVFYARFCNVERYVACCIPQ
jgi:hypothetical protein